MTGCIALIVAAGRGTRLGSTLPKQYLRLGDGPLLRHAVRPFLEHPAVDAVRVVIHPDDDGLYQDAMAGLAVLPPVPGGATRQDSVREGLESLSGMAPDAVLIHDGARPFVHRGIISGVLAGLEHWSGCVPGLAVVDTLKRTADSKSRIIQETVDRSGLWRAQTPQGFRFQAILTAHRECAGEALTDDAAVAERAGFAVGVVDGDPENVKVTTEDDIAAARARLAPGSETRTGLGFDVHRFGPGDRVMLCGVAIAHDASLEGHSDADVALHAITDALLGAISEGDIGSHFPPSDPRWRGAPSALFLRHAADRVAARSGRVLNIDVTLICERPRVGPHRDAMRASVAAILGVPIDRVSVKATTTEKLGFTGRGEGIAAQAIASVRVPAPSGG